MKELIHPSKGSYFPSKGNYSITRNLGRLINSRAHIAKFHFSGISCLARILTKINHDTNGDAI